MNMDTLVTKQRMFYQTHKTKDIAFRKKALRHLKSMIIQHEDDIKTALYHDLHKSGMEAYMTEIGLVLSELTYQLRHIDQWSKAKRVHTPIAQWYATSYCLREPYGVVFIMAPWNYPFLLSMEPLIGAIAAGNTVILKPSADAPYTSAILMKLISDCFPSKYVAVVEGGRKENVALLKQRFDYIFFTGSKAVGKQVMEKASHHLTPVTLELGGKSPCIVAKSADIKRAAKRIAFGKFLNAGQTCVAPDYVLVQKEVKNEFLAHLHHAINEFFQGDALAYPHYPCIINQKHFKRLCELMHEETICIGGRTREYTKQIEPTVLDDVHPDSPLMQEEIFGPLLPIVTFDKIEDAISFVNEREKPLALYLFTRSRKTRDMVLRECSFGGGCINDTIVHLATSAMGFGGVGASGMGSYHGYASFTTFTHSRSVVKKATWIDLPFRYHPYTKTKEKIVRIAMK